MIIVNGITITSAEQLEEVIANMTEYEKQCLRNDFYGIPNEPVNTVQSVTPRQMRLALVMSGISLETIESIIDGLPEPQRTITKVTWEYSVEFQRNNPLLNAMAPILGLTKEQVDNLFALASTL
jgi:hypothetical protein